MSGIKRFLSDTIIYGFTTIASRLLNFLLTPIFTSKLRVAEYGVFNYLYSWAAMINAVLAFGMETTYFRYLQKVEEKDRDKVFDSTFFVTIVTAGLFAVMVLSFTPAIAAWIDPTGGANQDYMHYIRFFTCILIMDALAVIPFAKLRAENRPIRFGLLKFVNIFTVIGFNLFFLFFLPDWMQSSTFWAGVAGSWFRPDWVLGNIFLSNLIASGVTLLLLLPQMATFRLRPDAQLLKNMLWYSFPILVANISFIINEHLDKIMLPRLLPDEVGTQEAGIYGVATKIAVFLNLFVTGFRLGAEPFFFSYAKNEHARKTYAGIMEYFVVGMIIMMVGISANIDWLKHFIQGRDAAQQELFWSGMFILPVLLFNYVLLGIYMNLSIWYKLSDQTRYGLYISGVGAVMTIVLNLVLIPRFSFVGAAVSTTVVYLVMVGLSYYWGQKNYPIPYPVLKIGGYLVVGILLSWAMFGLFDNHVWLSNALLIGFVGLVFLSEWKNIRGFL